MARPEPDPLEALAHDLRTGLTVIKGHADLSLRRLRRGDPLDSIRLAARLTATGRAVLALAALAGEIERRGWRRRGGPGAAAGASPPPGDGWPPQPPGEGGGCAPAPDGGG